MSGAKLTRLGDVLAELASRRGFARVRSVDELEAAWREAAGPVIARYSRVGRRTRTRVLHVAVANSSIVQEISLQKEQILLELNRRLTGEPIHDLRTRVVKLDAASAPIQTSHAQTQHATDSRDA